MWSIAVDISYCCFLLLTSPSCHLLVYISFFLKHFIKSFLFFFLTLSILNSCKKQFIFFLKFFYTVWEESIVLLPHRVRFVFLSATIPNASEFAAWVARVHMQPCHVVYTGYRPTPLQHYMFPAGGEGVFLIVDEKGKYL